MISSVRLQRAVHALRAGELIAYPTEGVWGLGCDPLNAEAVFGLLALKQRPLEKGLILVAASVTQLAPYLNGLNSQQLEKLMTTWPGPNTWLVPANAAVPYWISGGQQTVALRVSAHPLVQALCKQFGGAIVSTSANRSGKPANKTMLDVQLEFSRNKNHVILLPGSLGKEGKPSVIRDLVTGEVIRP